MHAAAGQDNRPGLIYIASNGRSGSTLLDMVLGAHRQCWTMGEFQVLPFDAGLSGRPCGCGRPIPECPFWWPVVERSGPELDRSVLRLFREGAGRGRVLRPAWLARMLLRGGRGASERYGRSNAQIMARVLEQARAAKGDVVAWLVDASKDPYRLYALVRSGRFDLAAVHLVKDPRAFVHSMTRGCSGLGRLAVAVRMSLRYVVENAIIELASRELPGNRRHRLRYEDLATDPEGSLEALCGALGMELDAEAVGNFRQVQHGVSGNLARHEDRPISLDSRWRRDMPRVLQALVYGLVWPQAVRYGYRWSDNRD